MKIIRKQQRVEANVNLPSSKSESNRVLIIRALAKSKKAIENLSEAEDTLVLDKALNTFSVSNQINIGHAGTAMRFLTAFLSLQNSKEYLLLGSKRMEQRPIEILVTALTKLGANIGYQKEKGFPPLIIKGKPLKGGTLEIDSSVSSQYISALLMIAPLLENGLTISLQGKTVSSPYLEMTIDLMRCFDVVVTKKQAEFRIENQAYNFKNIKIESDWSAASYWFEIAALSSVCNIQLNGLFEKSRQGDSVLPKIFESFGVVSSWNEKGLQLTKKEGFYLSKETVMEFDLTKTPDLAQALVCTCVGMGVKFRFIGLSTLVIKETNRLEALKNELNKFNVDLLIKNNSELELINNYNISKPDKIIKTYQDHRMAMAFAPLCLVVEDLEIEDSRVVKKSYPNFWGDVSCFVESEL